MSRIKLLSLGLGLVLTIMACNRENFEETMTEVEVFSPPVTSISEGQWEFNLDGPNSTHFLADSIYCDQIGTKVSFIAQGIIENPPGSAFYISFFSATNPIALDLGTYPLEEVIELDLTTWQGGGSDFDTLNIWESTQLNANVEIISSETLLDPFFQVEINEISGFINGVLQDDEGQEYQIQSAFNKIIRYKI